MLIHTCKQILTIATGIQLAIAQTHLLLPQRRPLPTHTYIRTLATGAPANLSAEAQIVGNKITAVPV